MKNKYDIILFDADGTLFDFEKSERVAFMQTCEYFNLPFSGELYSDYHLINDGLWKDMELGLTTKAALLVERWRRFVCKYSLDAKPADINKFYLKALGGCSFLLEGAEAVCRNLAYKRRLFLVTNGETTVQRSRFGASEIKQYFSGVFVSEEAGAPKPYIEYFNYVFSRIRDFSREKAIIIGDSLSGDIRGGNNAGLDTCWFNPGGAENTLGVKCDYIIKSLDELYDIL